MSSSQVVTGEAVALELRPAALPSRFVAGVLDGLLQLVVLLVVGGVFAALSLDLSGAAAAAFSILLLVSVFILYPVLFETLLRGRTPGKAAMGLRVVRDDGGPIGFRHALVRGLTGAFLERPGLTLFLAGVVTMLLNPRDKRLGDLLAGTVVLQERVSARGGQVAQMPPQLAAWAATLDLSGLSDDLALSVRQFVSRSRDLTPTARDELGGKLVTAVTAAVRPPPPPGAPGWAVLAAVLAERRRREQERVGQRYGAGAPSSGAGRPYGASAGTGQPYGAPSGVGQPVGARDPQASPGVGETPPDRPSASPDEPRPTTGPGGFVAPF